jgi:hypothetical protein
VTAEAVNPALIDEERIDFERAQQAAMAEAHRRMLDKAAEILRTDGNPTGLPAEDIRALINERLSQ